MFQKNVSIEEFTVKERYLALQNEFLNQRVSNCIDIWSLPLKEPIKTSHFGDFFYVKNEKGEEILQKKLFNRDVIYPKIDSLGHDYFESFKDYKDEKGIFGEDSVRDYCENKISELRKYKEKVKQVDYLEDEIKSRINSQLDRAIEDISNFQQNPYPMFKPKLRFKWNKADVIYFFHLLRDKGQIQYLEDVDYGLLINRFIEYQNKEGFVKIEDAAKRLGDYKQSIPKPAAKSTQRLKQIFNNNEYWGK